MKKIINKVTGLFARKGVEQEPVQTKLSKEERDNNLIDVLYSRYFCPNCNKNRCISFDYENDYTGYTNFQCSECEYKAPNSWYYIKDLTKYVKD